MKLNIIKGAINSEKTTECVARIDELRKNNPDSRVLFVVPEQFSYSAEKLFTSHFGGTGLNNIEVMTMSRLSERYLNRARKNYLTSVGKAVLIQKAVNEINKEENVYGGCIEKTGFVNTVSDIITELKRSLITPDMLLECADKTENNMLKNKLLSVAEIYSKYQKLNDESFYDAEEDLTRLSIMIKEKGIFSDTDVFVDEFFEFYPQHYKVLESIMLTAKSLTVTLPVDEDNEELSILPLDTLKKLKKIARNNGVVVFESYATKNTEYFESDEISFYFENYNKFNNRKFLSFDNETRDISLYAAVDPYSEVETVAKRIRYLIDKEGYRYKDFAVCCGNLDEYENIIQAVFGQYNIKYFTDLKLSVIDHPVILTVISLFDIIKENWSYDSVFGYLKTGFIYKKENDEICQYSPDDIDLLDYYVLKYGIRGKKKWLDEEDWELKLSSISDALSNCDSENEDKLKVNNIRREIVAPIKNFIEKTSGKNTVVNIAKALFEFLEEINLYEGLQKEIDILSKNNMINEAKQISQIWNILIDVLDQITTALGDTKCSRDDFKKYLFAGLSVNEISIIPPTLDGVSISQANSVKNNFVKALFIVGATRGAVPLEKNDEGMFSDSDRKELDEYLESKELEIRGDTSYHRISEEYKLFRVLFTAKKLLNISYPLNNFNGEAQIPSQLIIDLKKIFKNIKTEGDLLDSSKEPNMFFTVNSAFDYLLKNRNNKKDKLVGAIYKWFLENDEEKLDIIKSANSYKTVNARITSKNAELLYSEMLNYSASRLKVYADCPFKYFMKYGLGAKPEEVWQIQKFDLGTLMHYIICKYCETVEDNASDFEELRVKWKNLTDEKSDKIIDDIIKEASKNIITAVGKDENKINYLLLRIKNIIKRSAELLRTSLTKGEYVAVEYEKGFCIKLSSDERSVGIKGTIDRIDVAMPDDESTGIRVIDYKSGKKDFSVVSVCNMQDIQLVLYATAAVELFKMGNIKYSNPQTKAKITGIMYNKLKDSVVDAKGANSDEIKEMISKDMRLNGVVILDTCVEDNECEHYDISDAVLMDADIETKGSSSYLKIDLKNDGQPRSNSDVMTRSSFNKLQEYVKHKILETDAEIMNGNIEILPFVDGNSSACDYCDMREVCLFDSEKDSVRNLCKNADEAWEIIDSKIKK